MADRSILAAGEWEPQLRQGLLESDSVLLLMTPRSKDSLWVAAEAGAAWVLKKPLIPVLMFVEPEDIFEPVRRYQARRGETSDQVDRLIAELLKQAPQVSIRRPSRRAHPVDTATSAVREDFTSLPSWEHLLKIGEWHFDGSTDSIFGEGIHRYLLSRHDYGATAYRIDCRLAFMDLKPKSAVNAVNAGIVLGWRTPDTTVRQYLNLLLTGDRLLLEKIGSRGGSEYRDWEHVDEGVPFRLELERSFMLSITVSSDTILVEADGEEVYWVSMGEAVPTGRVGLRPWRSVLRCEYFAVEEI
jgi:hypothetical protein